MQDLRQSTASQEISLGQFLDSADGDTEENGLTIANTDIKLRKHNTTTLANKNSGGATNISNGVYHATLDATDTDTTGMLEIYVHVAGALAVKSTFRVLTASAFDALYIGTFNNLGGTAQTGDNFVRIGAAGAGLTAINLPNQTMDITGNITGNLSGSVGSVTAAVTVGTMNANVINAASIAAAAMNGKGDWNIGKTGYSLTQSFPTNFADMAIVVTTGLVSVGTIAANVIDAASIAANAMNGKGDWNIGKTGYTLTQSFPSNFASLVISATGDANSDVNKINGSTVLGNGTSANLWRG